MFVGERAARPRKVGRGVGELRPLALRFRPALAKLGDAALRAIAPLIPGRPLCDDCGAPRGSRGSLAGNGLRGRPGFGEGGSLARGSLARAREALRDIIPRAKLTKRGPAPALRSAASLRAAPAREKASSTADNRERV